MNRKKSIFQLLTEKPWESDRAKIDDAHIGKTFDLSVQTSAVIIIFGIATVLFSLIFTGYIYSIPPEQDTRYLLKPNFLWINTFVLFVIAYFFSKITSDLKQKETIRIKRNIILVGGLSYLFLFGQLYFWVQLMQSGNYVSTNTYFSSFYFFTALHGIHLLGGLFFWGKVTSKIFKLEERDYKKEERSITALSVYWLFLFIVWFIFFTIMFVLIFFTHRENIKRLKNKEETKTKIY